jgi:spore germination protein GerM
VASADTEVSIYLVSGDRLAEVRRPFAAGAGLKGLLALVTSGPTDAEASAGLRSALSATAVVDAATANGQAEVALSEAFASLDSREQVLAIAQVVYTTTADPAIHAVRFTVDGKIVEVPNGQASLVTRPVTRADYAALAPR